MSVAARILDANANRSREALRVMEDAARFALDDSALCGELKSIRHELRAALDRLPSGWLEANRDTAGDVGTSISTTSEMKREGLIEVVIAAGKRLGESLRVMEEVGKTVDVGFAQQIESIRYQGYVVESQLQLRFGSGVARQWKLCVLLTKSLCKRPWKDVLRGALAGGADCIQVREKEMDGGELVKHVREVIECAKPQAASVIVNDRADVALAAGADGVHGGQHDLAVHEVRRIAGRNLIIGVSTHDLSEARAAIEAGADYCGVGAMFSTALKPDRQPSGTKYLREFIERCPKSPHLAIGGITLDNINELIEAGARGVAVSSAVGAADDPEFVVRRLIAAISDGEAIRGASPASSSPLTISELAESKLPARQARRPNAVTDR